MTPGIIFISDAGKSSFSASSPLKLSIDGRDADIQVIVNLVANNGRIVSPIDGDDAMSWAAAPKMNGIVLFSYLARHGIDVGIIDAFYAQREQFSRLLGQTPLAVVISTTFINDKDTLRRLAADIRQEAPDIPIIAGGPFVYTSYLLLQRSIAGGYDVDPARHQFLFLDASDEPAVDLYIVSSCGEAALLGALQRLRQNRRMGDLPNTARFSGTRYEFSARVDDAANTDNAAIEWKALPGGVFRSGVMSLQASTGCVFNCAFCNFSKDHRLNRIKSIDGIVEEMIAVSRRGIKYVWFVDDNFRLGKKNIHDVCRRFIDEDLKVKWMTFIRADVIDGIDIGLLKAAGCTEVQMGLESGDRQILKNMNKRADPVLYDRVIRNLLSAGINCSCYFIFGFPGETAASARRTREWIMALDRTPLDGSLAWSLFPFYLVPMSPIYEPEMRKVYELTGYMQHWHHRTMDSNGAMNELIQTFLSMAHTGPIYRGDNLEYLSSLDPATRNRFHATRHALSKKAFQGRLEKQDIVAAFRRSMPEVFGRGDTGLPLPFKKASA